MKIHDRYIFTDSLNWAYIYGNFDKTFQHDDDDEVCACLQRFGVDHWCTNYVC